MDTSQSKRILEGLLFVSGQPVTPKQLKMALPELDAAALKQLVTQLNDEYAQAQHAFQIQEIAGGYQLVTDPKLAATIKRALELPREDTLSKPALETLAIIAYRQPLTKAEIEIIRGVDVGGTLETLLEHHFVRVTGRKETPGRPLLYGTTTDFLRHFGLKSLEDLPPMTSTTQAPVLPLVPPKQEASSVPSQATAVSEQPVAVSSTTEEKASSDAPAVTQTN